MQDRQPGDDRDPEREGLLGRIRPSTGTEPVTARSPLRLRLLLALLFTPLFIAGAVLFWAWASTSGPQDAPTAGSLRTLAWISTVLAVLALVDLVIVQRRIRRGRRARR
ncbi:DUF6343 family protein [Streptomyces sp. TRM 70351]|uniref:DUF6343 family protein n=1 Tax=Streptomyces sp. TRM 70351 TaxID=3116552 RepID=UPI002E7B76ED|nr:DUF6343 family protein [Streptomyces sp. TRM 70351]MEE1927029.1 DUF6343 family protein [Streptomyces sp. TRM 70351]